MLLAKTNQIVGFDISAAENPHLVGRTKPSAAEVPYVSQSPDEDWIMMPVGSSSTAIAIPSPVPRTAAASGGAGRLDSGSRFRDLRAPSRFGGRADAEFPALTAGSPAPDGPAQPRPHPAHRAGLFTGAHGLLAVSTRSGSIHLLELAWRLPRPSISPEPIAAAPETPLRR